MNAILIGAVGAATAMFLDQITFGVLRARNRNRMWHLIQLQRRALTDAWDDGDRLQQAGSVLLRTLYESGVPYSDPEVEKALAVFARKRPLPVEEG